MIIHDFAFGGRESEAVLEVPDLGGLDEVEVSMGMSNETVIVNKKENWEDNKQGGGRRERDDEVREGSL